MSKKQWTVGTIASGVGLLVLLVIGLLVGASPTVVTTSATTTTAAPPQAANVNLIVTAKGCDRRALVLAALKNQGFNDDQMVIGESQVDWTAAVAHERGEGAFSQKTPEHAKEVVDQLKADDPKAKAALQALKEQSGASEEQLLNPLNWEVAQFKVESTWAGNTQYQEGKAVPSGERKSAVGDVVWLFVHPDKCQQAQNDGNQPPPPGTVTAHRAGCGNPQLALPTPTFPTPAPPAAPPLPGGPPIVPPGTTPPGPPPVPPPVPPAQPPCLSGKCIPPPPTSSPPTTAAPPPAQPPPGCIIGVNCTPPGAPPPPGPVTPPSTVQPPAPPPPTSSPPTSRVDV